MHKHGRTCHRLPPSSDSYTNAEAFDSVTWSWLEHEQRLGECRDAAIVSAVAGTTRDTVQLALDLGGHKVSAWSHQARFALLIEEGSFRYPWQPD